MPDFPSYDPSTFAGRMDYAFLQLTEAGMTGPARAYRTDDDPAYSGERYIGLVIGTKFAFVLIREATDAEVSGELDRRGIKVEPWAVFSAEAEARIAGRRASEVSE